MPVPTRLQKAWDDASKFLEEDNDPESSLDALRNAWDEIENEAQRAKTLSLAADAGTELGLKDQKSQKAHWQKAYKNYSRAISIDPKNKETRRKMNKLASMMDEKAISLGIGFQMVDQGNPTPMGILVMIISLALVLTSFKLLSDLLDDGGNPIVEMEVQYTSNDGEMIFGVIKVELYIDDAPLHVESFIEHAESSRYDGVEFHRVISGFMIQGGEIENKAGSGGYAARYYGYCNGEETPESQCPQQADWTIPHEHENGLKHTEGAIAAAHAGVNTDGSQFYIVPENGEASHLDWEEGRDCTGKETQDPNDDGSCHTVFGYVISGLDHVTEISKVETTGHPNNTPVNPVRIVSAQVTY